MELCEWTATAIDPGDDPRTTDEWVAVEGDDRSPFADERAVAYRTTFADPRDGDDRALLTLDGLYAHARVWLNGALVGRHDTYFTPFRLAFDPQAENELIVACAVPDDRFGGVFETALVPTAARVPAIRGDSHVEAVPENVITDLTVGATETDDGGAVNAIVTIDAGADLRDRISLSLGPADGEGTSALSQVSVSAAAGSRVTVRGQLSVRDPERWWPRGFGSPARYTVRATLGESERETTTGFRTVGYDEEGLSVNGTRVPVRGVVSLPADHDTATELTERARAANATLIRPYGHVPPHALYDAADAAGLLVMQDVPLGAGALDVERARAVARTLAGAYGHHPSLAAFGVHDDAYDFETRVEEDDRQTLRATGENDHAATATAAAAALPGTIPVLPTPGLTGESSTAEAWVLDGYAGSDRPFAAGSHIRHVVAGTHSEESEQSRRAIAAIRCSGRPFVTAFAPRSATRTAPECEETIAAAFAPVGAFLDETAADARVVLVNDTPDVVAGTLEWTAGVESGTHPFEIGPLTHESIDDIDVLPDARVELTVSLDDRASDELP